MEAGRTRCSDERIDDLALSIRDEMRDLRAEMREGFREVRADIRELRTETREIRAEGGISRRWLVNLWATTLLGFAGLIVESGLR